MKHIAVIGTGTIGLMLGGFLARGGHDVTIVSQFRPEMAEKLSAGGVTIVFSENRWVVPVRAVFTGDLARDELFDVIFLTGKSNDTADALDKMLPHLKEDGFISSLQNGINDDIIAARAGKSRVIPCVCFAGGQCPEPGTVVTHDGRFVIGELTGERTPRVEALGEMLSCVKAVEISADIMAVRWKKLSEVCLTVPAAAISGYFLFAGFEDVRMQRLFGKLAVEVMGVRSACGYGAEPVMGLSLEDWRAMANGPTAAMSESFLKANAMPGRPPKGGKAPAVAQLSPVDAYTQDIKKGRPLEIWYTNGYVAELGEKHGLDMPTNRRLLQMIREIEAGQRTACVENLDEILQ